MLRHLAWRALTRDIIAAVRMDLRRITCTLPDNAGLREAPDEVEAIG